MVDRQLYSPLADADRSGTIAERIKNSIALGFIRTGDRLPNELDLAASFSVAPATVRESLTQLRSERIIETRRGRHGGSFVIGSVAASGTLTLERLRRYSTVELRDLGDEWTAITVACYALARDRYAEGTTIQLERSAADFAVASNPESRTQAYSRFWVDLAVASQSARLLRHQLRIQFEVAGLLWPDARDQLAAERTIAALRELVRALPMRETDASDRVREAILRDTKFLVDEKIRLDRTSLQQEGDNVVDT